MTLPAMVFNEMAYEPSIEEQNARARLAAQREDYAMQAAAHLRYARSLETCGVQWSTWYRLSDGTQRNLSGFIPTDIASPRDGMAVAREAIYAAIDKERA